VPTYRKVLYFTASCSANSTDLLGIICSSREMSPCSFLFLAMVKGLSNVNFEQLEIEIEIEHTLFDLMQLEVDEKVYEMSQVFARLLASVEKSGIIDSKLNVLVEPEEMLPETKSLLLSLQEVKRRYTRRRKLLTHRDYLKIWLRMNTRFKHEFLPGMF
jgi:hypothetical protein